MVSNAPVLCRPVKTLANMELAKLVTIGLLQGGGGGPGGVMASGQLLKTVSVGLSIVLRGSWWTIDSFCTEPGREGREE